MSWKTARRAWAVLSLLMAPALFAATLRGVVRDSKGVAVAGAQVTVRADGIVMLQAAAGPDGSFAFEGRPRRYVVALSADGFAPITTSAIPFSAHGTTFFTLARPGEIVEQGETSPVRALADRFPWEMGVLAQGGVGVEDRSNFKFLLLGGHAGKVLTPNIGSGLLQGNFEYAVEVFPFWQSYTPRFQRLRCTGAVPVDSTSATDCSGPYTVGGTYTGVSITPIILRWNLTHGERWMPWIEGAGGVVWTNHKYPAVGNLDPADIASNGPSGDTSVWNFTPQFGIGTHYFVRPRRSLDFRANAVHLSSASLGDKNPGVNASVQFSIGYTWWQ